MPSENTRVRRATSLEDYEACVAVQKDVWKFFDPADYASIPLLKIASRYGGSVLIAEGADGAIQGFAYALLARTPEGRSFWWSHMTAVSSAYRGRGIGFQLKLAQRDDALRHGISQISWTFDPLQAPNAHFNIRKLGAVALDYQENLYGISSSPLHAGLPTDRLRARWDLASQRVLDRISGAAALILRDFDGIVRVLEDIDGSPGALSLDREETPILMQVPASYPEKERASSWQDKLRVAFTHYLGIGYTVTDFILLGSPDPQAFYVLER